MTRDSDRGESLRITEVVKRYGSVTALDRVNLSVDRGEFLTILGPSGSGKTTLLKIVAGFEHPTDGTIRLEGRDITYTRPAARDIGMVFQNYALFPHMNVAQNVAFPLRMRKMSKADMAGRIADVLSLVELSGFEERLPSQLSGGQQQRVALARAIAFNPPLLLLDEPFGALDRKLREQMQVQVRRLQRRLGLTAVFVTHDQEEALLMSDRIVVMNEGLVHQIDTPENIYAKPQDRFVADFVGESNIFPGVVTEEDSDSVTIRISDGLQLRSRDRRFAVGEAVHVIIRPESAVSVALGEVADLSLTVAETSFTGGSRKYRLSGENGFSFTVRWPSTASNDEHEAGDRLNLYIPPEAVQLVQ